MQRRMTLLRNASAFTLCVPPAPDVVGFAAKPFELAFTTTRDEHLPPQGQQNPLARLRFPPGNLDWDYR